MWLTIPMQLSGEKLRLRFSDKEGNSKLHILQTALWADSGDRVAVTFDGKESRMLEVGQECYSDPILFPVSREQFVTVAVAFRGDVTSGNCIAAHVQCSKDGNFVSAPQMDISRRGFMDSYWGNLPAIPAITAIEVLTEERPDVIACFGDSITQQGTWTAPLERMLCDHGYKTIVLNAGIGGNRLLLGPPESTLAGFGPAAIQRFERDVLRIKGVTSVILALGTNDIGWIRKPEDLETAGADAVFSGLKKLADIAHRHNLKVYAATLTPRMGSLDYSPVQEMERMKLNEKIMGADCFDAVIDFAAATADKKNPAILAPHCDSGDHLHPSALGGIRMAKKAAKTIRDGCG